MATKNLLQAIQEGLAEEMRADDTVMVMGEDVGRAGGVFRVTEGLAKEFGPFRAMDTPLAESLIVGAAIGLSVNGMRPVAEIQFADFIPRLSTRSSARPLASTTAPTALGTAR
jgi:2-oxoisovalerate dehydrogenase E1 component subunit beta